jgi:hypothetical protein
MKLAIARVMFCLGIVWLVAAAPAAHGAPPIRAGMIGLDTSHAIEFTKILHDPKAGAELAQMRIVAGYPGGSPDNPQSWSRVKEYSEKLRGMGVEICGSIDELLDKVDVVLLESVDGRPHLAEARPVIARGKPLYIDKPMAASLADAMEIFRLAKEKKVPCFSASSLRFSDGFLAVRSGKSRFGKVESCVAWSPLHLEPHHPDLFWYGIHGVEILYTIMGTGCKTVTRVSPEKVVGQWADGRTGTFIAKNSYGAEVVGSKASGPTGGFDGYKPLIVEIVRFFKSRRPPVSAAETLELLAFMEAADQSKRQGGAAVSIESVMAQAARQNAARKKAE